MVMAYDRDSFLAGLAVGRTLWRPTRIANSIGVATVYTSGVEYPVTDYYYGPPPRVYYQKLFPPSGIDTSTVRFLYGWVTDATWQPNDVRLIIFVKDEDYGPEYDDYYRIRYYDENHTEYSSGATRPLGLVWEEAGNVRYFETTGVIIRDIEPTNVIRFNGTKVQLEAFLQAVA